MEYFFIYLNLPSLFYCTCPKGTFENANTACTPYLYCPYLEEDDITEELQHSGHVKRLFKINVGGVSAVKGVPRDVRLNEDFRHGMQMVKALQGNERVVQLIGYCDREDQLMMITKFYNHGSADRLDMILDTIDISPAQKFRARVNTVRDYLAILTLLHHGPLGARVMCDSNDVTKTLSQFLVTDQLGLVVNDLDALPQLNAENGYRVKCGQRKIFSDFVAPEQLWPHEDREFNDADMPGYDEKTDIWKMPPVILRLLGKGGQASRLKLRLVHLLNECKQTDPKLRPSAQYVLMEFLKAIEKHNDEL